MRMRETHKKTGPHIGKMEAPVIFEKHIPGDQDDCGAHRLHAGQCHEETTLDHGETFTGT